jgi:hypothetical protein
MLSPARVRVVGGRSRLLRARANAGGGGAVRGFAGLVGGGAEVVRLRNWLVPIGPSLRPRDGLGLVGVGVGLVSVGPGAGVGVVTVGLGAGLVTVGVGDGLAGVGIGVLSVGLGAGFGGKVVGVGLGDGDGHAP